MWRQRDARAWALGGLVLAATLAGCVDKTEKSTEAAAAEVLALRQATEADARELAVGLPKGAAQLASLYAEGEDVSKDLERIKGALARVRSGVPELNGAKATFFALATPEGQILRSDLEVEQLAGRDLYAALPPLRQAPSRDYLVASGTLPGAEWVKGRAEAQYVTTSAVKVGGAPRGVLVAGWSWSFYAYRLETVARGDARTETEAKGPGHNVPLLYAFVVVGDEAYGARTTPDVSLSAIQALGLTRLIQGEAVWKGPVQIAERPHGVAAVRAPALGAEVVIGLIRQET